ncbi:MAG TPA: hypothetical protein VEI07_10880 [Planctomycetaceae bacterium]|nr:hypothetical protein [Planctomycetaceae bacterium]
MLSSRSWRPPNAPRSAFEGLLALGICGWLIVFDLSQRPGEGSAAQATPSPRLASDGKLHWYRGNLHTHSMWSDGDDYLEMVGLWYKDHGYDFVCFTDHNRLAKSERWVKVSQNGSPPAALEKLKARFPKDWVEERTVDGRHEIRLKTFDEVNKRIGEPGRFLLMQGEEISDLFGRSQIHINAYNVQEAIPPMRGKSVPDTLQNNFDAVIAQRERTGKPILAHLNHPNYYYGLTAEDVMRIRGANFFEVYSGHPSVHNSGDNLHASTDRIWDIILANRLGDLNLPMMYALATDDAHRYHHIPGRGSEPGRGWVMVLAPELTPEALIASMEAGRFYASCGVKLRELVSGPEGLDIAIEAEPAVSYRIDFIGTRSNFNRTSEPIRDESGKEIRATRHYSEDIGVTFKTVYGDKASYRFGRDELYVRAHISSNKHHPNPSEIGDFEQAWVQPVRGPAALNHAEEPGAPKSISTGGQAATQLSSPKSGATPEP